MKDILNLFRKMSIQRLIVSINHKKICQVKNINFYVKCKKSSRTKFNIKKRNQNLNCIKNNKKLKNQKIKIEKQIQRFKKLKILIEI